jgi:TolB-like protein/Tfp pilus assembly protein PilF/tRNA A-37 threonylcarbamoyl transferase component Bud32
VPEIPGYSIERVIGRGGMATVYLATQLSLGRHVALKLMSPHLAQDPVATERFLREARIAAKLHHPHIIDIHDVGVHEGVPYMAMAYEPGGTIARPGDAVETPSHALQIVRDIAAALDFAHRQGVVHRDVKPENILRRADGACVLSDFGIARAVEIKLGLTGEGTSVGTPHYMSPEQWRGEVVDGRSDLYSLGVVLFQLLTGELPFRGSDGWSAGMQHMSAAIPRLPPHLQHLQGLVDDLLAKDPAARPQTGLDLIRRIEAFLSGPSESITASFSTPPGLAVHTMASAPTVPTPLPPSTTPTGSVSSSWVMAAAAVTLVAMLAWQPWRGGGEATTAAPTAAPAAAPAPTTIAVLPFEDLSEAQDQAYFADGLAEELLDLMATLPQLRVAGRASSFRFRDSALDASAIGRDLGVSHLISGSVRRAGSRLRVSVRLLNTSDGFQVFSESYERELDDVLVLQDEIARAMIEALKLRLLPQQQPHAAAHRSSDPGAYTEYLRGRQLMAGGGPEATAGAIAAFTRATELDPGFASAYARLAQAQMFSADFAEDEQGFAAAQRAALESVENAIRLAPDLVDGYWIRGNLRTSVSWDWSGARSDYQRALELEPTHGHAAQGYGALLASLGDLGEAIAVTRRVAEREPLLASIWQNLGYFQEAHGDLASARESQRRALALRPKFPFAHYRLAMMAWQAGDLDSAAAEFEGTGFEPLQWVGQALVAHRRGDAIASQRALDQLVEKYAFSAAFQIAEVHAGRGDHDAAFAWLQRAHQQHDGGLAEIKYDPIFAPLRSDRRYRELLTALGLPP